MIQLTEVSIDGIKEYRRREQETWVMWIGNQMSWHNRTDPHEAWNRYQHSISGMRFDMLERGLLGWHQQPIDHRMVLNWTWENESLKNRKWGGK